MVKLQSRLVVVSMAVVLLVGAGCTSSETFPVMPSTDIQEQESRTSQSSRADDKDSSCDPYYSGCVPIASDVDCAGGSGNGPAYVNGPVRVVGSDKYDLDRDGDGIACE